MHQIRRPLGTLSQGSWAWLACVALLTTNACIVDDVRPAGRPCNDNTACGPGTYCDLQTSTCRVGALSRSDAGTNPGLDAEHGEAPGSGRDAAVDLDGTSVPLRDTGPSADKGTPIHDAGPADLAFAEASLPDDFPVHLPCGGCIVYQSATSSPPGQVSSGGLTLSATAWPGWRFQVPGATQLTTRSIGLHARSDGAQMEIFGAIVRLRGQSGQPEPLSLTGSDVMGTTTMVLPDSRFGSQNVSGNLAVELAPGWYALVFGVGSFGTSGGSATVVSTNVRVSGVQSPFSLLLTESQFQTQDPGARMFVEAVP